MKSNKGYFPELHSINLASAFYLNSDTEFDNVFTLIPKTTPVLIRKCSRCEKNRFTSSDKFRINAHKKIIDVWLIYKCISCESTLNLSILSRKPVSSIDKTLLNGFYKNDIELV